MKTWRKLVKASAEAAAVLLLVFILIIAVRLVKPESITENGLAGITPTPTDAAYPPPWGPTADPTILALMLEAEATQRYEPPTPTVPPLPTLRPTPVVTPIPLAEFPVLPGQSEGTFTIVYRQENTLRAVDSDGQNDRLLLDVGARLPLFLVSGQFSPSPDGSQLALVLSNLAEPPEKGGPKWQSDIYLFDMKSGNLSLLIQGGVEPSWSPDGSRITYVSIEGNILLIYDISTSISNEIYSIKSSDSDYRINSPSWSPDSMTIAFIKSFSSIRGGELWIVNVNKTDNLYQLIPMDIYVSRFSWSPHGDRIAFLSPAGEYSTISNPLNIWVINVITKTSQQLTYNISSTGGIPSWSQDCDWISFEGINLLEAENHNYDLWLVNVDGTLLYRLTNDQESELYPVWLPQSDMLICQNKSAGLMSINLFDGLTKQLIPFDTTKTIEFVILPQ
ncbi:MAG: hypothetical protein WAV05_08675 [Anaerolineales bacterium]